MAFAASGDTWNQLARCMSCFRSDGDGQRESSAHHLQDVRASTAVTACSKNVDAGGARALLRRDDSVPVVRPHPPVEDGFLGREVAA